MVNRTIENELSILTQLNWFENLINELTEVVYKKALLKKETIMVSANEDDDERDEMWDDKKTQKIEKGFYTAIIPNWYIDYHKWMTLTKSDSKISLYNQPVIGHYSKEIIMDFETHFRKSIKNSISENLLKICQLWKLDEMISEIYN